MGACFMSEAELEAEQVAEAARGADTAREECAAAALRARAARSFLEAAVEGDAARLGSILQGERYDLRTYYIRLALMIASEHGHAACVHKLLETGQSIHFMRDDGMTVAMLAAGHGHVQTLRVMGWDCSVAFINRHTVTHETALTMAARGGHARCVKVLLDYGASVSDAHHVEHYNALMYASMGGHVACVELLWRSGRSVVVARGPHETTALHLAARGGHTACVRTLLRMGAWVNLGDEHGVTPIRCAVQHGHVATMEALLAAGARVGYAPRQQGRETLLMAAVRARTNAFACVSGLLGAGANVNVADALGVTPLLRAVQRHDNRTASMLLEAGANANAADARGETALMWAVWCTPGCVPMLLGAGAEVGARSGRGHTAIGLAIQGAKAGVAAMLLQQGAEIPRQALYILFGDESASESDDESEEDQVRTWCVLETESRWRRRRPLALAREQRRAIRDHAKTRQCVDVITSVE